MPLRHDPGSAEDWRKTRPEAFDKLDPASVTGAIAVVVFHGMGQQAQFETLNDVINAFIQAHRERGWSVKPREDSWLGSYVDRTVDLFKPRHDTDDLQPVGQITLEKDGKEQEFDFYEAYWAPLTEGQVNIWQCLRFLLRAACDGMLASFYRGGFKRVIFGETVKYAVGRFAGMQLLLALLVVASLTALALVCLWVIIYQAILSSNLFGPKTIYDPAAGELREILGRFLVFTLAFLFLPLINAAAQKLRRDTVSMYARIANIFLVSPLLLVIAFFGCATAVCVMSRGGLNLTDPISMGLMEFNGATFLGNLVFIVMGGLLLWMMWYFGVKYLGDVVAYVSAHAVNRFWAVRQAIQERCLTVVKGVYNRKKKDPQIPDQLLYQHVAIVSHSLGSVIAYDILNWLVTLELCGEQSPCLRRVEDRTRLFLTCGSPLNKIAFLFRFNSGLFSEQKEWRDRLSNYRQPLILSYKWRPHRWINIWSYPDWISGRLSYYESPKNRLSEAKDWISSSFDPALKPRALRIQNLPDSEAFIPLYSHTSYFRHKQFRAALYHGLWSEAEPDWGDRPVPGNPKAPTPKIKAKAAAG